MKLKNKKTGEIKDVRISRYEDSAPILVSEITPDENGQTQGWPYNSLAELNEEWEDYEEPKKFWWINERLTIYESEVRDDTIWLRDACKQTGNYFLSREEAEKAVKKLKAWKRLKDKGMFVYLDHLDFQLQEGSLNFEFNKKLTNEEMNEADKDLDLLFGGEE